MTLTAKVDADGELLTLGTFEERVHQFYDVSANKWILQTPDSSLTLVDRILVDNAGLVTIENGLTLTAGDLTIPDDSLLGLGTGQTARFSYDTTDTDANELLLQLPAGGGTDVPVLAIGQSIESVDLGLFNGVVDPNIALFGVGAVATATRLRAYKARGTIASPTAITTGDDLFTLSGYGYSGAAGYVEATRILLDSTGTIATTRVGGIISFYTATDAAPSVLTLAMSIGANQNVTFEEAVILAAGTAPAGTSVYAVNDNTGDLTFNALNTKTINLAVNGVDIAQLGAATLTFPAAINIAGTTSVTFNNGAADVDFIVKGDNLTMLTVDAATDSMAIGGDVSAGSLLAITTTVTAAAGVGIGLRLGDGTITAAANGNSLESIRVATMVIDKGAYTGLTAYLLNLRGVGLTASGAGVIAKTAVLNIPSVSAAGTVNYAIFVDEGTSLLATTVLGTADQSTTAVTGDTLRAGDMVGGTTSDAAGADLTIAAGLGTGTGDEGTIIFQLPVQVGAGSTIQTRATRLTLDMAGSATDLAIVLAQASDIRVPAATAAALEVSDGTTKFYAFDTRVATAGVTTHALDISDYTIASDTTNVVTGLSLAAHTLNYSGNTQVTTQVDTVVIGARTILGDGVPGALIVDEANTLLLVAPTEGATNTTLTAASALRIIDAGGTPANQYGIYIENLTAGATKDYSIYIAGANALHLGSAGVGTGLMEIDGTTSGTVTLTVAAIAGTWTLTLPATAGEAGDVLVTDGAGASSWVSGVRSVDVQLTNAQVLALRGSPFTLVAAPGANRAIIVHRVHFVLTSAAGAYTETDDNLVVEYAGGTDITGAIEATGWVAGGARSYGAAITELTPVADEAVQLFNTGDAEWGGGNAANSLSVRVWYSVVDTVAFT